MRMLLAGLALFLAACVPQDPAATVRQLVFEDRQGWCSAVVVAPGKALTAKHCAEAGTMIVDGKKVTAVVLVTDTDLAKLTVPGLACPCAEIGQKPEVGSKVKAIGFPGDRGGHKRVTEETTVWLIGLPREVLPIIELNEVYIYTHKNILVPGDSGGGLFQSQWLSWKLIGINSHIIHTNPFFPAPITSGFVPVYE